MEPSRPPEAEIGQDEHAQVHHEALRDQDQEVEAAVVPKSGVLVLRDGPVADEVVSSDLEYDEHGQCQVGQNQLKEASDVALVLLVGGKVDPGHLLILVGGDLPAQLLHILARVAKLDRESALLDIAELVFIVYGLVKKLLLALTIALLIRV